MKIDPHRLRSLRLEKGLTRPELARRSGSAIRTIQRLENEPQQCKKSQEHTLTKLSHALGVETGVLTGESSLPESNKPPDSERVQIGAQIAPKARLAYDLVKRRYGVSVTEIINMAPLFFALLAEGSLAWRRKKLEEAEEAKGHLEGIEGFWVGSLGSASAVMKEGIGAEIDSIQNADLFGEHLFSAKSSWMEDLFDPSTTNPFASYLRGLKDELAITGIVEVGDGDLDCSSSLKFPDYDICRDKLEDIANGSVNAKWALETGYARLSEIPEELMREDAGEERAKWLEDRLPGAIKGFLVEEEGDTIPQFVAKDPKGKLRKLLEEADINEVGTSTESGGDNQ